MTVSLRARRIVVKELKAIAAGPRVGSDDWWSKMSPEEQKAYIRKHPNSKHSINAYRQERQLQRPQSAPRKPAAPKGHVAPHHDEIVKDGFKYAGSRDVPHGKAAYYKKGNGGIIHYKNDDGTEHYRSTRTDEDGHGRTHSRYQAALHFANQHARS